MWKLNTALELFEFVLLYMALFMGILQLSGTQGISYIKKRGALGGLMYVIPL